MLTTKFTLTLGVNKGQNKLDPEIIARVWQVQADSIHREFDILVGGTLIPARAVTVGCPMNGDKVGVLSGIRNPELCTDDSGWRIAVRILATRLRMTFEQATASLEFTQVDFEQLKG